MARNTSGILGNFHGKVGTVVGCRLGDTFYIRSLPRRRTTPLSGRELANIAGFKQVQNWLSPLREVLQTGFRNYGSKTGGVRAALSYNRMHAVAGVYPGLFIDVAKVKLSGGTLPGAEGAAVTAAEAGQLQFVWDYVSTDSTNPLDQVMLVAYDTVKQQAVYTTTGNFRRTGADTLTVPDSWSGRTVHVWLAFTAADRSRQSESMYLGEVICV